ncbi:beta-galactosidase [Halococcus sp. IIIV-5B]|uniref:beta-galactosidase n=1 Tax=Halococcus sp. IIIV-5B TaxID=2321230 RepID=UPI000E7409A7|nr:beta-galactosidase [Halococcus sp. IIIV-5B]RJT07168.1 beta-galactosidase [Halococcus sp. IIIV-5B]
MSISVCYFPEHWPQDQWEKDVATMAEVGIEFVRMGEFSWSQLEPKRGKYNLAWLEEAVDLLGKHDLKAVLCTPTATPPKWLIDEHPDIRQKDSKGITRNFGGRRHYCFNSKVYREESSRIIKKLASHFADHSAVVGWQTDNEYGCHGTTRCYCGDCATAFRGWLKERYESINELNEEWGTTFWSQNYQSFGEVDPPRFTPADHNPSHLVDYARFSSESVAKFNRAQTDLLREINSEWFLTHNFMSDFPDLNFRDVSPDLDFPSVDSYPTLHAQIAGESDPEIGGIGSEEDQRAGDPDVTALNHALYRGGSNESFWIMENQSGDIMPFPYSAEPADGMMRLWAHAAIAHGARTVSYFRWRRCQYGQEQYWGGLNDYDGSADRGLPEAAQTAEEIASLPEIGNVNAPVAIIQDYESWWAINAQPHSPDFDYWTHLRVYFRALRQRGIDVDVISPYDDFSSYKGVVAPSLYIIDNELAKNLSNFVEDGGELILGTRSGYKDRSNRFRDIPAPGPLTNLVGGQVKQHESLAPSVRTKVSYHAGKDESQNDYRIWGEWLTSKGGKVIAEHLNGPGAGEPACIWKGHGEGSTMYVGVWPTDDFAGKIVEDFLNRSNIEFLDTSLPDRVRFVRRGDLMWILNHGSDPIQVDISDDSEVFVGESTVPAHDVLVFDGCVNSISTNSK